ncbi:hypothetical protein MHYP_G00090730 [Metynnis hypsauchen]
MMFLCVMLISAAFMEATSENFKVVGPAVPLVAEAGQEELVLPCSLQPNISAEGMTVEWIRTDVTETDKLVHLYEDRKDRNDDQMESYRGRTALFKEELKKGNTSLKLSAIRPSDEGAYQCFILFGSQYDDATLYVEVKEKAFHSWKIAIICISVFIIGLIAFVVYILKEKRLSPAQCSAVAYMHLQSGNVWKEWDLKKYRTSEEGYRRLIPAITNCRKARLVGCNLTSQSVDTLKSVLQTETSSLKELDLSNNDLQDTGVQKLSAGLKSSHCKLETLRLVGCKLTEQSCDVLQSVLQTETSSLKELDLSNNNLSVSGVQKLSAGLSSSCCKLEILRLVWCKLTEQSCDVLQSVLQTETSLKDLDLSNNDLPVSGVQKLSAGLSSSSCKLETLRLVGCKLTEQSCDVLKSVLQTETSLKDLDLSNNNLQDSGVEKLSAGLSSSHCKLETLRLALCKLSKQSCATLQSVLQSENSSLKELDLSNNDLEELGLSNNDLQVSGVEQLSVGLKSSQCKLEVLRLTMCKLNEQSCNTLQSILQTETFSLKELDLSSNDLQDSGVKLLSAGLKKSHCTLETLRLSGCMITEEGCSSLASALSSNPSHLKELDLTYNHPGESGVKLLTARMKDPQCTLSTLRVEHGGEIRIKPGLKKYSYEDVGFQTEEVQTKPRNSRIRWQQSRSVAVRSSKLWARGPENIPVASD